MGAQGTGKKKTDFLTPLLAAGGGILGLVACIHFAPLAIFTGLITFLGTAAFALGGTILGIVGGVQAAKIVKHRASGHGLSDSRSLAPEFAREPEKKMDSGMANIKEIMPGVNPVAGHGVFHHAITGLNNSAFARSVKEKLGRQNAAPAQELPVHNASREI